MRVPVTIPARNEERALGPCLDALLDAAEHARAEAGLHFDLLVVLDECTDGTADVARGRGVRTLRSSGGKVEAQRAGLREGPFAVFVDADVLVTRPTLAALAEAMLARPEVMVAFPPKLPLPPVSHGRLARALHVYNREHGFSTQRTWFNGKCFAIRRWSIPSRSELAARIERLPVDRFHDYAAGMRVDDVYLSRRIVSEHGPAALCETERGCVYFRAPETLRGMYRYYRRMRMELQRIQRALPRARGRSRALRHPARRPARPRALRRSRRVLPDAARPGPLSRWLPGRAGLLPARRPLDLPSLAARRGDEMLTRHCDPRVMPLEIWDVVVDGVPLYRIERGVGFGAALGRAAEALAAGVAESESGTRFPDACRAIRRVVLVGGAADEIVWRSAHLPAEHSSDSEHCAELGGLAILRRAGKRGLVVDLGQSRLKIGSGECRRTYARDFDAIPVSQRPVDGAGRQALVAFVTTALREAARAEPPEALVLALPCEIRTTA